MTFLRKIILVLNLIAAAGLVAGGSSIFANPAQLWILSFFGLAYSIFLFINIFFIFFWIIVHFKYGIVSIVAIVLTLPVLKSYFSIRFSWPLEKVNERKLKVMSYNVRNFDLYQWSKKKGMLNEIVKLIEEQNPDIVCFQEFYNASKGNFQTINTLMDRAGFKYYFFEKTYEHKLQDAWGIATFSRYPIVNTGLIKFEEPTQNSCCYTDVRIDSLTVRIFNIHLQSVYLSDKDYKYLEDISENQNLQIRPTEAIASKLKQAFIVRGKQAIITEAAIKKSPYPVVLCGDFNDTPASFAYHTLSSNLQDAFLAAGWGIGPTYSGVLKVYRIDYIFTDKFFSIKNYKTICEEYSDHYPIMVSISY